MNKPGLMRTRQTYSDWVIPTGASGAIFVMLVPLPGFAAGSAADLQHHAAVMVLLTAIQSASSHAVPPCFPASFFS